MVDTPKVLFYNKHLGKGQIPRNFNALRHLLKSQKGLILVITPLLRWKLGTLLDPLLQLIHRSGNTFFYSQNDDPDKDILEKARETGSLILSNDKFRDYPDFSKYIHCRRVTFTIRDGNVQIDGVRR